MDNLNSKGGNINNQPEPVNTIPIKIPKNVRQVGSMGSRNKVIYVEDYVMTYIKQLSDKEHSGCRIAVLLGYYIRTEESKNIFIKGAIEMMNTDFGNGIAFSDEGWTSIYENIKRYFSDVEIVGWSLIGPEFFIESEEKIRKIHMENFSGSDKVFLKMDSMEKEEAFYINENNQLVKLNGYYIYYEKNEEMQNYMVENKEAVSEEKNYTDHTTRKIRNVIQEKKEIKDDRSIIRLLYAASTLLAIIVLVIAATMLDNYDKMKSMETALNTISKSLNIAQNDGDTLEEAVNKETGEQTGDNTQVTDGNKENSQVADADSQTGDNDKNIVDNQPGKGSDAEEEQGSDNGQETTVETIEGNVNTIEEDDNKPADDADGDNIPNGNNSESDNTGNKKDTAKADDQNDNSASAADNSNSNKDDNETVQTSAPVKYYIVHAGDTLASISHQLYNTFSYMDEIKKLNGIEDENKIYEGQKLIVP